MQFCGFLVLCLLYSRHGRSTRKEQLSCTVGATSWNQLSIQRLRSASFVFEDITHLCMFGVKDPRSRRALKRSVRYLTNSRQLLRFALRQLSNKRFHGPSVAIWAQAISCSNVHSVFPVHEHFWCVLSQVSTTQFCSFPPVLMASVDDVPFSPMPGASSNYGSPDGSGPSSRRNGSSLDRCTVQRAPRYFGTTRRVDSQILTKTSRQSVKPWVWSPPELPVLNRPSTPTLPRWRHLQHWNST